jgi:HD-GYP domain-containing protein (c-di-GMP phosphodiesterase class II)
MPSVTLAETTQHSPSTALDAGAERLRRDAIAASRSFERWFETGFVVFEGTTGDILCETGHAPRIDWPSRAELCRQAACRSRHSLLEDEDPIVLLAVPLADENGRCLVAVGAFCTRRAQGVADVSQAAAVLGIPAPELFNWAIQQRPRDMHMLEQMADLVLAKFGAEQRIERLEDEVEKLSGQMSATFEEISLIYRVTQNLKISSDMEDLGQVVLDWLHDALPVEGLAIQFIPPDGPHLLTGDQAQAALVTHGACPVDSAQFSAMLQHLEIHEKTGSPLVLNQAALAKSAWPFPGVRDLMLVPLAEGKRLFGWLAAFNHRQTAEFGTVEASLLSSIGAILGIHSSNLDLYRKQAETLAEVVRAMSAAIDAKDPYTRGHSDRVARVAVRLAQEMGCNTDTLKTLYLAGQLHDIGKIGIDDNVLRKPGKLTDAEFEHVKTHAEIGYRILRDLRNMGPVLPVVLHHHEAWDGSGYPYGMVGTNIPFLARIAAVADAYDAMSSDRPYRAGMPDEKLDAIMKSGAGKQWDPDVVAAFFRARDAIREISSPEHNRNDAAWLQFS